MLCLALNLSAQGTISIEDAEAFENAQWQVVDLGKGAQVKQARIEMFNSVQVISILKYPARRFTTVHHCAEGKEASVPSKIGEKNKALAVVNAGFFRVKSRTMGVYLKVDGKVICHKPLPKLHRLNGLVGFKDKKGHRLMIEPCDTLQYDAVSGKWHTAMSSGPVLMKNGKIVAPEKWWINEKPVFYEGRHPRTVIGKDKKGNMYMVVIDGRFPSQAEGTTIYETAQICGLIGMSDAINLDGGGSTALWTNVTGVINHPCDNKKYDHTGERIVPSTIVVY